MRNEKNSNINILGAMCVYCYNIYSMGIAKKAMEEWLCRPKSRIIHVFVLCII